MLGEKKSRKRRALSLLTVLMVLVTTVLPMEVFAATNSSGEYVYKYIGTDSNNKGNSIYYKENGSTKSGSTIMFKLRKDNNSTIDLAYCCDLDTYTQDNTYYKRTNIENAGYFDEDTAKQIRNVVVHGYDPNNRDASITALEDAVNAWAKVNNRSTIRSLSKEQAITATQLAIWSLANDYMSPYSSSSTVTLVKDYLVSLPEVVAGPTERVVETIDITAEILKDDDSSEATVRGGFTLYAGAIGSEDKVTPIGSNLALNIKAGDRSIYSGMLSDMMDSGLVTLNEKTLEYEYNINDVAASYVRDGVKITINFSGTQNLPKGAYFYKTPNRVDSQNFVGIAEWSKAINVSASATAKLIRTGKTDVSVTKVWKDAENQDGIRPASVQIQLLADGEVKGEAIALDAGNNWTHEWKNLEKYNNGSAITYRIQEVNIPEGYASEITGSAAEGFVVTNSYAPKTTSVSVSKAWEDADNQDGLRTEGVEVQLYANGEAKGDAITLDAENGWTYEWTGLAKNKSGEPVEYTVKELNVQTGYEAKITGDAAKGFVITNIHKPVKTTVSVEKKWDDANDQDRIRPASVTVQLKADGKAKGDVVTLNADNNWRYVWTNLDKNKSGKEIAYTVEELNVPTGYIATVTGTPAVGFVITNSHVPAVTTVQVAKVWDDANDQDRIRPASVTVQLLADDEAFGEVVVLDAENSWAYEWTDLAEKAAGKTIVYTVKELNVPVGYEAKVTGSATEGYTITNTHAPAVTAISVEKVWNDNMDQDGIRPDSVTVQLMADGKSEGKAITLSKDNNWKYEWTGLAAKSEGIDISYRVVETSVPKGYTAEVTGNAADGFVITNSHTPAATTMTVAKVWDDADNQDGIRPDSIKVQLFANDKEEGREVVLDAENNWTYEWENLPINVDGKAVEYKIDETAVPDGYTKKVFKSENNVVIINSHTPAVETVKVTKEWDDNNDQDGIRPDSVKVQLLADGKAFGAEVTLNAENNWTYEWTELAKRSAGEDIKYTVEEVGETDGYKSEITGNAATGYTVKNIHKPETIDIEIEKLWEDLNNIEGLRSDEVEITLQADGEEVSSIPVSELNEWNDDWEDLPKYANGKKIEYTISVDGVPDDYETDEIATSITEDGKLKFTVKSKYVPRTSVVVTKVWDDNNDQDGIRPESVQVQLYADGEAFGDPVMINEEADWTYTWENLLKYSDGNSQAELVKYTVEEVSKINGYKSDVTGDAKTGYIITNSHTPETTTIDVTKVWNDANDQDGLRPGNITVQLLANGTVAGEAVTISEADDWTYTWTELAKFEAGEEIVYTIAEAEVAGYTSTVTGDVDNGFTLTNTHTPAATEVKVTKVWDDEDDQDGIRPALVEVKVLANGKETGKTAVLSVDNNWTYTWTELAKFEAGKEITYTVEEDSKVDGYKAEITGNAAVGYTITNIHEPECTEVEVSKAWNDNNDQDGIRPESIEVQLYADGDYIGETVTLNADNKWSHTWKNLDKYAAGEEIEYTVTEAEVPEGYTEDITGSMTSGHTITNTHKPEVIEVNVIKVWDDNNDQDGLRPKAVEVQLYANDEEVGSPVEINETDDWTYTWTELAKFEAGKEIAYTVAEATEIKGYEVNIAGNAADGYVITNSHTPAVRDIVVTKVWEDEDDQDGIRPGSVEVQILANGKPLDETMILDEANRWSCVWENLDQFAAGEEIVYEVKEREVSAGYTCEITGNVDEGFIITNAHEPEETEVTVNKVWDDADNQDGIRPESIEVQLYANDKVVGEPVEISEADGWTYTWTEIDKNEAGKAIVYTVAEVVIPEGYTCSVDGSAAEDITITNTHEPEVIKMFVLKKWIDNSNQEDIRPDNVEIQLYGDEDKIGKPLDLNDENEWKDEWSELPKNEEGKEIDYSIDVTGVPEEYTTEITDTSKNNEDGFIVVSEYEPPVEVSVQKVWNDEDDKDKLRTRNVKVQLYADGKAVGAPVKIDASEDWKYTWTELEKYDETEKRIKYTVDEVEIPEGYTKTISGNAEEGFTITNTHVVKAVALDDSTDTGDDSCMLLWAMMLLTSLAIMILILVMSRKRNSQQA